VAQAIGSVPGITIPSNINNNMLATRHSHQRCRNFSDSHTKTLLAAWLTGGFVLGYVAHKFMPSYGCCTKYLTRKPQRPTNRMSVGLYPPLPCSQSSASTSYMGSTIMGAFVSTVVVLPVAVSIWTSKPAKHVPVKYDTHTRGSNKALQATPLWSQEDPFVERCRERECTIQRCSDSSHVPVTPAVLQNCVDAVASGGLCAGTETAHHEIQKTSPCRQMSRSSVKFNQLEEAVSDVNGSQRTCASPAAVLAKHGIRRYRLNPEVQRAIPKGQPKPFLASTASLPLPRFGARTLLSGQTSRFS